MENRAKGRLFAICGIVASFFTGSLGCSAPPQDGNSPHAGSPSPDRTIDPLAPGASIVCGVSVTPEGTFDIEVYMLSAMNHKLRFYPEFAAELGIDVVTDCESARKYWLGYAEYRSVHPDFDADEPRPPSLDDDAPKPSEPSGRSETQKIQNGLPSDNDPVVSLEFAVCRDIFSDGDIDDSCPQADPSWSHLAGGQAQCTGTFINRNWILTSAHCLTVAAVNHCVRSGEPLEDCDPQWINWGRWTIQGTHQGRAYKHADRWARAYVHEKWSGRNTDHNSDFCPGEDCVVEETSAAHDIALLYVPSDDEHELAPTLEDNGAKRLSLVSPPDLSGWDFMYWGWGLPLNNQQYQLKRGLTGSLTYTMRGNVIFGRTTGSNTSVTCAGDSGGPLMRERIRMVTNAGEQDIEAIVGVLSSGTSRCTGSTTGEESLWTRVDVPDHTAFIHETLRRWPPYEFFRCGQRPLTTTMPPDVVEVEECWGKPCTADAPPCTTGETCWHPASAFRTRSTCGACGTGAGCSCVVGQCMPKQ